MSDGDEIIVTAQFVWRDRAGRRAVPPEIGEELRGYKPDATPVSDFGEGTVIAHDQRQAAALPGIHPVRCACGQGFETEGGLAAHLRADPLPPECGLVAD